MKSKFLCFVLAASMACTLAACGGNATSQDSTDASVSDTVGSSDSLKAAYNDTITDIITGYKTDWGDKSPDELGLSSVYNYESQYVGYVIKDINGDGKDELLIGENIDGDDGGTIIYDVFTPDASGAASHVFCGGERDSMHITSDGVLMEHGSNGADDSFDKAYVIKDSLLTETDMPAVEKYETLELELIENYVR